jgi:eukaryotic-like serine/threonine-protein kinase
MKTPSQFGEVKRLFELVCDLPTTEQRARLMQACNDSQIVAQVEGLLAAQTQSLRKASLPVNALLQSLPDTELAAGDRVGAWRLVRKLASGGMGAVYLAERADGHFEQQAAIKLLRGLPTAEALMHLSAERQMLATLQHPHIARLLDGGATPGGQPFLVLEYVEGVPIDDYCKDNKLDLAARLKLFQSVCRAVQFAHQRLIVHCDLKPSNILVRPNGEPVLLDFGIARALDRASNAAGDQGERFLTPRYASPEQLSGAEISTSSDVYSLGLMLFELLTGRLARIDADDHTVTQLGKGECRPSEFASDLVSRRRLRGDLDAIVLRATATEPSKRYASAEAFAADIGRHLELRPVQARAQTLRYRYARLLQRRWPLFAAGTVFVLLATVFTWRVISERDRAIAAEHDARVQATTAQQVSDFLVSVFEVANPEKNQKRDVTAREILDQGSSRIDTELKDQPAVRARLSYVLARAYTMLGKPEEAKALYERSAQLALGPRVNDPLSAAEAYSKLAIELANHGHGDTAEPIARKALELRAARLPADDLKMADSWNTLGVVLSDLAKYDEAEADLKKALAIKQAQTPTDLGDVADTLHNIALTYYRAERTAEAVDVFRRALALKRQRSGDDHPDVITTLQNLGQALAAVGQTDEAIADLRAVLAATIKLEGELNDDISTGHNNIGSALHDAGRYSEAAAEYREAMDLHKRMGSTQTPEYAQPLNNLAFAYEDMGDYANAEPLYRESLALRRKLLTPDNLTVIRAEHNLGRLLTLSDKLSEAMPLIEHAESIRKSRLPADDPDLTRTQMLRAEWLRRSGDLQQSRVLAESLALHAERLPPLANAQRLQLLGRLAVARGDNAQAFADFEQAYMLMNAKRGATHPLSAAFGLDYASALISSNRADDAHRVLGQIAPIIQAAYVDRSPQRRQLDLLRKH